MSDAAKRKTSPPYSKTLNKDMGFFWLYVGINAWEARKKLSEQGKEYCVLIPGNDNPMLYDFRFSRGMIAIVESDDRIAEDYRMKIALLLLQSGCIRVEANWIGGDYETYSV